MRSRLGQLAALVPVLQLAFDVARDEIDREQVAQVADFGILLEAGEVGERHPLAQLAQALVGDAAVLDEFRVALEDRFREQFAARDLDPELALEAEDDVQEVDRLGAQIALQRGGAA